MNKSKLYLFGLLSMLLINVVLIGFLVLGAKHHGPPPPSMNSGPREIISNKLGFSEAQKEAFEAFIKKHQEIVSSKEEEIAVAKKALYTALQNNDTNIDSALNIIGQKQIEIEKAHLQHFKDIKTICTEDQMDAYNDLLKELGQLFSGPKDRRP